MGICGLCTRHREVSYLLPSQPCKVGAVLPSGKLRGETTHQGPLGGQGTEMAFHPRSAPAPNLGSLHCTNVSCTCLFQRATGPLESPFLWSPGCQETSAGACMKSPGRHGWLWTPGTCSTTRSWPHAGGILLSPLRLPCSKRGQLLSPRPVISTLLLRVTSEAFRQIPWCSGMRPPPNSEGKLSPFLIKTSLMQE